MGTVNDWAGTIGGTILGIELIVLVLVLAAINGGIAFGLWWVLRKMGWVQKKTNMVLGVVDKAVDRGTRIAAAPVILSTSFWRGLKAGLYRATHWPRPVAVQVSPSSQPAPGPGKAPRAA